MNCSVVESGNSLSFHTLNSTLRMSVGLAERLTTVRRDWLTARNESRKNPVGCGSKLQVPPAFTSFVEIGTALIE